MNKCCKEYGNEITKMMNKRFDKILSYKKVKLLDKLADFLFELTGNVNMAMALKTFKLK